LFNNILNYFKIKAMKKIYVLFLFSVLSINTFATHVIAGEITYTHLTGYTFKITVNIYANSDPLTTQADRCDVIVYFGDGDSAIAPRVNGPSSFCTTADGETIATNLKKNSYETTHTYPGYGLYTIRMEDPNREAEICNISNSVDQAFHIESTIYPNITTNNSAGFTVIPVFYAFVGEPYTQNVTAYDPDGDSLTYELVSCMGADGQSNAGYTIPPGFAINSTSGETTWNTPTMICKYNFAVKVKKWRNGYMIGYVIRDFQIRCLAPTSIDKISNYNNKILLYPNPVSDKIFISKLNSEFKNTLFIYDVTGRLIKSVLLSGISPEVDVAELRNGFYNYEILSDKTSTARGKFVKK
jgi:hypothetical protein